MSAPARVGLALERPTAAQPATLTDLAERLDRLAEVLQEHAADDAGQRALVRLLDERAERAETFQERHAVGPLARQLALVVDRMDAEAGDHPVLATFVDALLDALALHGVERVAEVGEPVDTRRHRVLRVEHDEPLTRGAAELVVAGVVRCGYRMGELVLRPAEVVARRAGEGADDGC